MSARLVVCFRYAAVECEPEHYLTVAQRIETSVVAVGAERIGWGADRYSFEFDPDDFPLVLRRVLELLMEQPVHGVGIGLGTLVGVSEGHAWGRALVVASALAGGAKPGEILVDPDVPDVAQGNLATLGRLPVRVGERYLGAALLLPGACPPSGYRSGAPSNPPSAASASVRTPSVFDALRSGDPRMMIELSRHLRAQQPNGVSASRLEAMALLAQGQTDQGLAQLRAAVANAASEPPLQRSQACLALAVGLARVGEVGEAALISLEALALARRSGDRRAEQASAQLLAQLAASSGANQVAQAWQQVSMGARR